MAPLQSICMNKTAYSVSGSQIKRRIARLRGISSTMRLAEPTTNEVRSVIQPYLEELANLTTFCKIRRTAESIPDVDWKQI